jgi:hypothetical protein
MRCKVPKHLCAQSIREVGEQDTGKDSSQKLMDVLYRSPAGPCTPLGLWPRVVHDPHTAHPTEIIGGGVFTKPLALALCNHL